MWACTNAFHSIPLNICMKSFSMVSEENRTTFSKEQIFDTIQKNLNTFFSTVPQISAGVCLCDWSVILRIVKLFQFYRSHFVLHWFCAVAATTCMSLRVTVKHWVRVTCKTRKIENYYSEKIVQLNWCTKQPKQQTPQSNINIQ